MYALKLYTCPPHVQSFPFIDWGIFIIESKKNERTENILEAKEVNATLRGM